MSMRRTPALGVLLAVMFVAAGCGRNTDAVSTALTSLVSKPLPAAVSGVWPDVQAFYTAREQQPAWVDDDGPTANARAALDVLRRGREHGLAPADYQEPGLASTAAALEEKQGDDNSDRPRLLAEFDVRLTSALLALGRDVALGRGSHRTRKPASQRTAPDVAASLAGASGGDLDGWLDTLRPTHREYAALQRGLADLFAQADRGGWPAVPKATLKHGQSHDAVTALRQRLAATGELAEAHAAGTVFDDTVVAALAAFQTRHGLDPNGVLDADTLAALNVPVETRIRQVERNLDRWRALPDELGARHFLVNIPEFHLYAREQGRDVLDMKVVVGTPANRTPVFSDQMETVVFSPYWNIPDSIVVGETAPAIAKDSAYMQRNQIEILRRAGGDVSRVDPNDVNWDDPEELKQLAFRQRPGAQNALGHVKFLFPNEHNVYLHDTPADSLFAREGRAFSHGCVRVEQPEVLARYVLRDAADWDAEKIRTAMHAGVEKHVKLTAPIPVHLVYFTAMPGPDDRLRFFRDIYGLD
jgi:murein L,D-transpeptidase YcbB/YkuD